jgi:hypothetical protein
MRAHEEHTRGLAIRRQSGQYAWMRRANGWWLGLLIVVTAVGCGGGGSAKPKVSPGTQPEGKAAASEAFQQMIDAGFPADIAKCMTSFTTEDQAELDAADDVGRETLSEARFRRCFRAARPATPAGRLTASGDIDAFAAAFVRELTTATTEEAFRPSEARCIARELFDGLGIDALRAARVSAGDLASYVEGRVAPSDLNLEISHSDAERIARAIVSCVDAASLHAQLWIYPGNLREWSHTSLENSETSKLRRCMTTKISPATTLAQVRSYLEHGPVAFSDDEGRALLKASLTAFEICYGQPAQLRH